MPLESGYDRVINPIGPCTGLKSEAGADVSSAVISKAPSLDFEDRVFVISFVGSWGPLISIESQLHFATSSRQEVFNALVQKWQSMVALCRRWVSADQRACF